jgi:hypothetical protein
MSSDKVAAASSLLLSMEENKYQYPFLYYFQNPRDLASEMERRKQADGPYPPSDVRKAWERKQRGQMQMTTM